MQVAQKMRRAVVASLFRVMSTTLLTNRGHPSHHHQNYRHLSHQNHLHSSHPHVLYHLALPNQAQSPPFVSLVLVTPAMSNLPLVSRKLLLTLPALHQAVNPEKPRRRSWHLFCASLSAAHTLRQNTSRRSEMIVLQ